MTAPSDPFEQARRDRSKAAYAKLKGERPDLFNQAVAVASLVTCAPYDQDPQRTAAQIERCIVSLLNEALGL